MLEFQWWQGDWFNVIVVMDLADLVIMMGVEMVEISMVLNW